MSEIKKELVLIPKSEKYIQYMLEVIMKLPRTEKFNIGNEYKLSRYSEYLVFLWKKWYK